jgi:hypothetical protein
VVEWKEIVVMQPKIGDRIRIKGSDDPEERGILTAPLGVDFYRIDHAGEDTYIIAWGWEIERVP